MGEFSKSLITLDEYELPFELKGNKFFLEFIEHLSLKFKIGKSLFFNPIKNYFYIQEDFTVEQLALIKEGHSNILDYINYLYNKKTQKKVEKNDTNDRSY